MHAHGHGLEMGVAFLLAVCHQLPAELQRPFEILPQEIEINECKQKHGGECEKFMRSFVQGTQEMLFRRIDFALQKVKPAQAAEKKPGMTADVIILFQGLVEVSARGFGIDLSAYMPEKNQA